MEALKTTLAVIATIAISIVAIVGIYELGFRIYEHYNPKYEQVRRNTYEQSRAFREGTVRDLENLSLEYARGDATVKAAIRAMARHRFADIPEELLTPNLRIFKREIEGN